MAILEGAVLPPGSLILVTGANGFVGANVVDQFLRLGYRVRGTVRDAEKHAWLAERFGSEYGDGKFELVEVRDLTDADALAAKLDGCAGLAAVASDVSFDPDPHKVIPAAVAITRAALDAAAATPSVQRLVHTSSSFAAAFGHPPGVAYDITPDTYNTAALARAWAPPPYGADRMLHVYAASKVLQERELWSWAGAPGHRQTLVVNAVLPDFVAGRRITARDDDDSYPSSLALLRAVFDGGPEHLVRACPPQWTVDAEDCAMLHVAAMLHPGCVSGERVFGYAGKKNLTGTLRILRELFPGRRFMDPPAGEGEDMANVVGRARAEELLRWVKGSGWTDYRESIRRVGFS